MSANIDPAKEECLSKILSQLDSTFGNQDGLENLVDKVKNSISNLKNGVAFKMADGVAQLVLKGESDQSINEMLKRNFPSGISIGNVEEMLKLVYVGTDTKNLKKAINFVQIFDSCHRAQAFNALYDDIKFKNHTKEPEMLLLQKKIRQFTEPGTVLVQIMKQVDADCNKIISRIVKGIKQKDYSISIYIANKLDNSLMDDNIGTIVQDFFTGTLDNFLLLIEYQYSLALPNNSNQCFMINALLKELEKRKLMDSQQGMHLWAHSKRLYEEMGSPRPSARYYMHQLCAGAIEKLSVNKEKFFGHYQRYVENPNKRLIRDLHKIDRHLCSIVDEFVSFYYNGDVGRAQNLLTTANAGLNYITTGRILSQLHEEMSKNNKLNSHEAFASFIIVKRYMDFSNFNSLDAKTKKPFEQLKDKAPACVRQLLWPKTTTEFQVVNKFFDATLSVQEDNNNVVCFDSADKRSNQTWKITIHETTSLLTLTHKQQSLQLGTGSNFSTCLAKTGVDWMVKAVDEQHFKIFFHAAGM
jgi:hypothetical protein